MRLSHASRAILGSDSASRSNLNQSVETFRAVHFVKRNGEYIFVVARAQTSARGRERESE